jgi:hypothetical protein
MQHYFSFTGGETEARITSFVALPVAHILLISLSSVQCPTIHLSLLLLLFLILPVTTEPLKRIF